MGNEKTNLEREFKYKRMETIYNHNLRLIKENTRLKKMVERAFTAGRSQTTWEQFLKDNNQNKS